MSKKIYCLFVMRIPHYLKIITRLDGNYLRTHIFWINKYYITKYDRLFFVVSTILDRSSYHTCEYV